MKKLYTVILLCATSTICFSQWNNFTSFLPSSDFRDVMFISSDTGMYSTYVYYAGGPDPSNPGHGDLTVYCTKNAAQAWQTVCYNTDYNYGGVESYAIYTVKNQHSFFHIRSWHQYLYVDKTYNGGLAWKSLETGTLFFQDFSVIDTSHWFLLLGDGGSKYFINKYQKGLLINNLDSFILEKAHVMFFPDTTTGYIAASTASNSNNHLILKSVSGGTNWINIFSDSLINIRKMYFVNASLGYAVADSGKIIKTSDGGTNWQYLNSGTNKKLNSVFFINDSVGFAAGDSGIIIRTTNGGQNWSKDITGVTTSFSKIFFVSDSIGFALTGSTLYIINTNWLAGIWEIYNNKKLIIYPNPSKGECNITIPDEFLNEKNLTLSIYDNTGKLIRQTKVEVNTGNIKLNLEAEAKGVYYARLSNGKKNYSGKIVLQ